MIERLSGQDAAFLYLETPTVHMHTLKVAVVDAAGGYSFERFRDAMSRSLHLLPPFRRRIVFPPLGLDHPSWIEDPDFDLDRHLARAQVAAPGGKRELAEVVSRIAGRQLDRSRPLWEITAIEGLAGGKVAFCAKLHHSLADGLAASALLDHLFGGAGQGCPRTLPPDPPPPRRALLAGAVRSWRRRARGLPGLVGETARGFVALARHTRGCPTVDAATPFCTPVTPFNRALSAERVFATTELPLPALKALRRRAGCTVNDVFLAVCAGALRRYLLEQGALPDRPLVVGVPKGCAGPGPTAPTGGARLSGNCVSNLFAHLPVQLADPVERLASVRRGMDEAKRRHELLGATLLRAWAEVIPPVPFAAAVRAISRLRLADRLRPPINLVVSSVPGPASPLSFEDAALTSIHSVGPILEGIGLNITAWSYAGELQIALLSCPRQIPDLWRLVDCFPDALAELERAFSPDGGTSRGTGSRRPATGDRQQAISDSEACPLPVASFLSPASCSADDSLGSRSASSG